jgi:hypothetical protein
VSPAGNCWTSMATPNLFTELRVGANGWAAGTLGRAHGGRGVSAQCLAQRRSAERGIESGRVG